MNPPTQPPPLPSRRDSRRRLARDLFGLLLVGVGTVGLLGALYTASPPAALFLIGLVAAVAGGGTLQDPPATQGRRIAGYVVLTVGLALITAVAYWLTPWAVFFGALLPVAVWLSGGEE
ncbi:hypothetical protein ABZ467_38330 [Streptomyces sp. NPDC005727]|uniref:hypothetical protein n=1 Tax=Streptomyces sp. NPDC005727 TaxID=3157053 RepID=UPI0033D549A1